MLNEGFQYWWTRAAEWDFLLTEIWPVPKVDRDENFPDGEAEKPELLTLEKLDKRRAEKERWREEMADPFLTDEAYLALSKVNDRRRHVMQMLCEKVEDKQETIRIAKKAEERYKVEVQSKQDETIMEKLEALKREAEQKGGKLTKEAAKGLLNMSDREIAPFWYRL